MKGMYLIVYVLALNVFMVTLWERNRLTIKTRDEPDFYYQNNRKVYKYVNLAMLRRNNHSMEVDRTSGFLSKVSIFTQITLNRLSRLKSLSQRWKHTIHCVLYVTEYSNYLEKFEALPFLEEIYDQDLFSQVYLHLVVDRDANKVYPINELRNLAWNFVNTKYAFSLDVDFIPAPNFDEMIEKLSPTFLDSILSKNLFVIPAYHFDCTIASDVNTCKKDLPFLEVGQNATDYVRLLISSDPYQIEYEIFYEPYFIGPTDLPRYSELFDIGNDKTSHLYELAAAGYKFWVIPNTWIAHIPHASGVRHSLDGGKYNFDRAWDMWEKFVYQMYRKYHYDLYCKTNADLRIPYRQKQRRRTICG